MEYLSKSAVNGFTVKIYHDLDPENPRDWTHGAELDYRHHGYDFPADSELTDSDLDVLGSWQAVAENLTAGGALLVLPVYMIDHSGVAFRAGSDFGDVDPGHWDSGQVGIAYVTPQNWADTQGTEWTGSQDDLDTARKLIESDVETYGQYVSGDVYGYVIEDGDGTVADSLWGLYGFEYAEQDATDAANALESREPIAARMRRIVDHCMATMDGDSGIMADCQAVSEYLKVHGN